MGESKKDPLDRAYDQLVERLEGYKPLRQHFDPNEVEFCRRNIGNNLKSSYSQAFWDIERGAEVAAEEGDEREEGSAMSALEARALIRHHLYSGYEHERLQSPKTKIQLNLPTGTAQLLEVWAKREDRTVSSCVMEATLRGLSAMKADGHIPAAVLDENEWQIRLKQIHEDIKRAMSESPFNKFED